MSIGFDDDDFPSISTEKSPLRLEFTKTQRGRDMLIYAGYRYVENRQSTKNKFWRCARYVKFGCRATIVTSKNPAERSVRLAGLAHSHLPEKHKIDHSDEGDNLRTRRSVDKDILPAAESDSDGGMAFDLIQKSLFRHPDTNDFYVVDLD